MPQLDIFCFFHEYILLVLFFGWLYFKFVARSLPLVFFVFFSRSNVLDSLFFFYIDILGWYTRFDAWVLFFLYDVLFTQICNHLRSQILTIFPFLSTFLNSLDLVFLKFSWQFQWIPVSLLSGNWSAFLIK